MKITTEQRESIWRAVTSQREHWPSQNKYSQYLGISNATYTQINKNFKFDMLANENWIRIAQKLKVDFHTGQQQWIIAETDVFRHITQQLDMVRKWSSAAILCDQAGIGKTFSAVQFRNIYPSKVAYIDCSQYKTRHRLIEAIGKEFGLTLKGTFQDKYDDLVYSLRLIDKPLIILDEAGDLEYPAFLELKAMYNQLEGLCGWYMMGADGLEAKIKRGLNSKKVGYAEIFDRFGAKYQRVMPQEIGASIKMKQEMIKQILTANGVNDPGQLDKIQDKNNSLRRLEREVKKIKTLAA